MAKNDEEANEELLDHLKIIDAVINVEQRPTLRSRLANAWKPLRIKAALAHIGLMISLAVYCVVGGIVSTSIYLHFSPLTLSSPISVFWHHAIVSAEPRLHVSCTYGSVGRRRTIFLRLG